MVRSDTIPVIGRNLEYEIIKSKKTIPLLSKMMNLDSRTIYKSIKSENVAPNVIKTFAKYFKLPISFFTHHIKDGDLILKEVKSWKDFCINIQHVSDFDYELKFSSKITKSEFNIYQEKIRKFIKQLSKNIAESNKVKRSSDKFHQLDQYSIFLELASLGEELNKNKIKVFSNRYLFWNKEDYDYMGESQQNVFESENKQHLLFTDNLNIKLHYTSINIGQIPPNPFEIFKDQPIDQKITINENTYTTEDFKNFWGSGFKDRIEAINEDFINEAISDVGYSVADKASPGFSEFGDIDNVLDENLYEDVLNLLLIRDGKIKEVNDEKNAQEKINKKK